MSSKELIKALRDDNACLSIKTAHEAADAIEQLQQQIDGWIEQERKALLKSVPKWIPVTERLPEDGSDILAVQSYCGEVRIVPANYDRGVWYDCVFNRVAEHITHWMPLPEPPKEEQI